MRPKKRTSVTRGIAPASSRKDIEQKPMAQSVDPAERRSAKATRDRRALGVYTASPASFPSTTFVSVNEHFIVIHDSFPKSSLHFLLLPRNHAKHLLNPFDALDGRDPLFLAAVLAETARIRKVAANELRRRHGRFWERGQQRDTLLPYQSVRGVASTLPGYTPNRNWSADIISGVHARQSMDHLHVHVLSVDRCGEGMNDQHDYNSFSTPFLIPVEDFPLAADDPRRWPRREGYLDHELSCWCCGLGFGTDFIRFKQHLADEFEEWKRG